MTYLCVVSVRVCVPFAQIVPIDSKQRRELVASGGLKIIQVGVCGVLAGVGAAASGRRVFLFCEVCATRGWTSQSLDRSLDPSIGASIDAVNSNYPAEVVEYCAPDFSSTLLSKIG